MDLRQFENVMKSFFNKAGVSLLKKGVDYAENDNMSSYILLDAKRNSYYLTEINVENPEILPDLELEALLNDFSTKNSINNSESKAILSLGKSLSNYKPSFTLPDVDLNSLIKKSALIITEDNVDAVKGYLDSNGVKYQAAPLKGAFTVLFIDKNPSEKLSGIFKSIEQGLIDDSATISFDDIMKDVEPLSKEELKAEETESISFDDIMKDVEPLSKEELKAEETESISFDDIMKDVEPLSKEELKAEETATISFDDIMKDVEPLSKEELKAEETATISFDDIMKDVEPLSKEELEAEKTASISFDDIMKDVEPVAKSEVSSDKKPNISAEDEDKMLDELDLSFIQQKKDEDAPEADSKEEELLYSKIINEQASQVTVANAPAPKARGASEVPKDIIDDVDKDDIVAESPKKAKAKQVKKEKSNRSFTQSIVLMWQHLLGIIFFAPAYLLKRITRKILPPFVVYWIFAITVFFGVYQMAMEFFAPILYFNINSSLPEISSLINSVLSNKDLVINETSRSLITSSFYFIDGVTQVIIGFSDGKLIKFLMMFGSVLMIFPIFRKVGAKITVAGVLLFFTLPLFVKFILFLVKIIFTSPYLTIGINYVGTILFLGLTIGIVLYVVIIFWLAGHIYTDKLKNNEVLH